jgi:hypothetical protein
MSIQALRRCIALPEILQGDYAAVSRQGEVFRLSPQKIDFIEVEQRLADVQTGLPSITEARLYPFEMARKYNNRDNSSIHNVFKLYSLDW